MDFLDKFMNKIGQRERARLRPILVAILQNQLRSLNIKTLQGHKGYFRCRTGDIRIIFIKISEDTNRIIDIDFRGNIYKRWK